MAKETIWNVASSLRTTAHTLRKQADSLDEDARRLFDTYEPCKICERRVLHPCDTMENYMESGPWDFACADLVNNRKRV